MNLFVYGYNVLFILLYTVVISYCIAAYSATNKKIFYCAQMLIILYLVEAVFIFAFDAIVPFEIDLLSDTFLCGDICFRKQ